MFSEEDANHIAQTEQNEGCLLAVDQLFNKLLKLKDLRWTKLFPFALKTQCPHVFDIVTTVQILLLKEDVFCRCRYTVGDTITSDGGILELQQFGVSLEIPTNALSKEEDISVSVVSPSDDHPPLGDHFILAPMILLEPDGLQFHRPVTLNVRHSGVDLKRTNLQVWKKTGNKGMMFI